MDRRSNGRDHHARASLQALPRARRRTRADELLQRVGLTQAADRKVRGYSGGMKRRLDLAMALVHSPRILFLDEPTTGLDIQSRTALWEEVSRLARDDGVATMGLVQAVVYLSVGLLVGVHIAAGALGVVALLGFAVLIALGFGALGAFAALRTGSGEAVQGLFPAFFVFLFLSSMNIPRNLIEITWFRDVATANPVSYLLECVRSLVITGWDGQALALGFGIAAALTVASLGLASWALKVRMAR